MYNIRVTRAYSSTSARVESFIHSFLLFPFFHKFALLLLTKLSALNHSIIEMCNLIKIYILLCVIKMCNASGIFQVEMVKYDNQDLTTDTETFILYSLCLKEANTLVYGNPCTYGNISSLPTLAATPVTLKLPFTFRWMVSTSLLLVRQTKIYHTLLIYSTGIFLLFL